jgi:predicted O-linked N-acetylglucosamine transferase (SPINDLY family)
VDYATRLKGHDLECTLPPRGHRSDRIRLGIYSWSLRLHTETFATLPIFAHLDPGAFDVRLYVHQSDANPIERRARRLAGSLTILPETVKGSVETIRADDLDILVFGNNRSAAPGYAFNMANSRMARLQCIHFCNPVTSGKRHIDCFLLGASIAARLDVAAHFTERILSIEGSGICFDLPDPPAGDFRGISRQSLGIPAGRPIFLSGANYFKIIPELRHTWAKILSQVPDSVLLLYPFGPAWAPLYPQQRLREEVKRVFEQYGISAERVIVMDTQQGRGEVLALDSCADVYLDAIPYNGATSLLDPLQEGVPPVVLDGRELRCSQGAAMLRELGIPELVTENEDEYVELAVRLGCDASLRNAMRVRVLERMRGTPDFLNPQLYGRRISHALLSLFADSSAVQPRRAVSCTESRPTL